jgi:glycogen operon protein
VLFDDGDTEIWRHRLSRREGDIHFCFVEGIATGQRYGLRAHGPHDPAAGQHFDPRKILLEPYACALTAPFHYVPELSRHGVETAGLVPKALAMPVLPQLPPRRPHAPSLIYELNVRSFTIRHPEVSARKRGTIAALAEAPVIRHFKDIGVDTIELMPIAAWIDERHLVNLGLRNAWGYNPVSFCAIDPRLAPGGIAELRDTVARLHEEGFNVVLDVVLNHTGEGDALGPTLSLRGLDNAGYYRLFHGSYVNDAGTGNTVALDRPHTVELAIAALRQWVSQCGIDGFRFDLATVMGRTSQGFTPDAPLIEAIKADPVLAPCIMIAEPWDVGPGGYQLGHFPKDWLEWNDRYRDDVRRFWRGDDWSANALATRIAGSSDLFARKGTPSRSINFVAAHDGFTLSDLLRYDRKHNHANGEDNRDGKNDEITCLGSNATALLATLFLSRGTPMLTAGDEFGRSQRGNNNAYAQDNDTTWLDWDNADLALQSFVAKLAQLRRSLGPWLDNQFLSTANAHWHGADGAPLDWNKPHIRTLILVLQRGENRLALIFSTEGQQQCPLPAGHGLNWSLRFSSSTAGENAHPHVVSVHEEVATSNGCTPGTGALG